MQIIERTEGHYDVQEVEFGRVYKWCPECVVVKCDCGERTTLTPSETTCPECGSEHASVVRQELTPRRLGDEITHPWRYAGDREGAEIPC